MLRGPQTPWYGPMLYQRACNPYNATNFAQITGITPGALWPCQEASGNLVDIVAANNLTPVATPAYRRVNAGKRGINCNSANDGFAANVLDFALKSVIIGAVAIWTSSEAVGTVTPTIIGRGSDTTFPSMFIYRSNDSLKYPTCLIRDAVDKTLILNDTNVNVVNPLRPCLYLLQIDRAANTARYFVADSQKTLLNLSGSVATHGTLSGGSNPKFNVGTGGSATGAGINLGFYAEGTQCEGATKLRTIANRLGYGN